MGEYRELLIDFKISQGIQIELKESIAPALGMSYGSKIALLPGQGSAEEFSTLVHELAHEMLHKAERRTATIKTVRGVEAVAFVVGTGIGLNNRRAPADYIHMYHGNAALLAESVEVSSGLQPPSFPPLKMTRKQQPRNRRYNRTPR